MYGVAVVSYLSCAIAFLLVGGILLGHRPTRTQFPLLILACLLTAGWAILSSLYAANIIIYMPVGLGKIIRDGGWFLCLNHLLKLNQRSNNARWYFRRSFYCLVSGLLLGLFVGIATVDLPWQPGYPHTLALPIYAGHLFFSILVLALIEQIYRGTVPNRRADIQLLCVGLGVLYCYEFYLYSSALSMSDISRSIWEIRGAVCATIAPLIGLSALNHAIWQSEILPSRSVIFRSTVFLTAGIYLAGMVAAGYTLREWGGVWGRSLEIVFFAGAIFVLCMMLSSGRVRAGAKAYISRNFFKLRYDYREEWIKFSHLLSCYDDHRQLPSQVIKALANMVQSPKGMLFEWEEKQGYVLKDCWNHDFPTKDVVIEPCAFTAYLEQTRKALELPGRFNRERHSLVMVPQGIRQFNWAWLLVPLIHGHHLQAFVILAHPKVAFFNINWEVLDLLSLAGQQAAICLVQEQNTQALAIAKQFEEYNRLSAFIIHDLKNVLNQFQLIHYNKEKQADNPDFIKSVYHTIYLAADKIERLLFQLRAKQRLKSESQAVALHPVLEQVIALNKHREPIPHLEWQSVHQDVLVMGDEESFINVITHLVENAQQATPAGGQVTLSLKSDEQWITLGIRDTGCGMEAEFIRTSLYKPFITTKGENGMGIGVYEAREYIYSVGGKLSVETVKEQGTLFTISLPIVKIISHKIVA